MTGLFPSIGFVIFAILVVTVTPSEGWPPRLMFAMYAAWIIAVAARSATLATGSRPHRVPPWFDAMRVAIAGGHGQIALRLAKVLSQRGDEAVALIRNPDHAEDVREAGAEPVVADLEHASEGDVAQAIAGSDAVVVAAGAGPGSGPARKDTMDYGGAVKLIAAANRPGSLAT